MVPYRRGDPRPRSTGSSCTAHRVDRCRTPAPANRSQFLLTHHGRRISVDTPARRTRPRRHRSRLEHRLHHTSFGTPTPPPWSTAGVSLQALMATARTRLGGDEPALWSAVRRHRPRRIRTRTHSRQDPPRTAAAAAGPNCRSATSAAAVPPTGKTPRRSRPAWPAGTACAPPPKEPAPTPTSASTARTSAPTSTFLPILAAQRADAAALAADADGRGWSDEADRHRRLIDRLDKLIEPNGPHRMTDDTRRPRRTGLPAPARPPATTSPSTPSPPAPGIGRATLYRRPELRAIIEEHRRHGRDALTLTGLTVEIDHTPHRPRSRRRQRPPPRRTTPQTRTTPHHRLRLNTPNSRATHHQKLAGQSYDNALAETINGLYKTELIKPRKPWRTIEEVELATAEWVDWFNHRRLYAYCGDIPPVDLEAAYYAQHRRPAAG